MLTRKKKFDLEKSGVTSLIKWISDLLEFFSGGERDEFFLWQVDYNLTTPRSSSTRQIKTRCITLLSTIPISSSGVVVVLVVVVVVVVEVIAILVLVLPDK